MQRAVSSALTAWLMMLPASILMFRAMTTVRARASLMFAASTSMRWATSRMAAARLSMPLAVLLIVAAVPLIVPTLWLIPVAVLLIVVAVPLMVPAVPLIVTAVVLIDFANPSMSRAVASVVLSRPCSGLALDKIEDASSLVRFNSTTGSVATLILPAFPAIVCAFLSMLCAAANVRASRAAAIPITTTPTMRITTLITLNSPAPPAPPDRASVLANSTTASLVQDCSCREACWAGSYGEYESVLPQRPTPLAALLSQHASPGQLLPSGKRQLGGSRPRKQATDARRRSVATSRVTALVPDRLAPQSTPFLAGWTNFL
jgi:hypothetical protein